MENRSAANSKKRIIFLICISILLSYFCIQYALMYWHQGPNEQMQYDALCSATLVTLSCYLISNTLNFFLPKSNNLWKVIGLSIILTCVGLLILRVLIRTYFSVAYAEEFDLKLPYRFLINFIILTWVSVVNIVWNVQEEARDNNIRKQESEKLLREAELFNLRQQLQPHFLFNSLNSIIALIGSKPEEARNMTFQLSDFLRGTMHKDDRTLIQISEEIDHLNLYLDIEKVRFGHRLQSYIDCDPAILTKKIPAMLIQPLVENAIKHGLYNTTGEVTIRIRCSFEEPILSIEITNPYDDSPNHGVKGTGFGISSVKRRLFLIFGRQDLLDTNQENQLFTCTLKIPQYD